MPIDMNEIQPGLTAERQREITREILKHLPQSSVTTLQPELDRVNDANFDPRLKAERDAQALKEKQSAPPPVPERAAGMTDQQWTIAQQKHATELDQYHQRLLDRPASAGGFTRTESQSLASACLDALRSDGFFSNV